MVDFKIMNQVKMCIGLQGVLKLYNLTVLRLDLTVKSEI